MCRNELKLRDVCDTDCRDLYNWRNNPFVRKNSFNTDPLSFDDHQKWFHKKKKSSETTFFLGYFNNHKIGVIRFDEEDNEIKVSVMLNPDFIGKGFGSKLIKAGVDNFKSDKHIEKDLIAEIKEDNEASIKAFERAGFQKNNLIYVFKS